jgi:hypothetical protein
MPTIRLAEEPAQTARDLEPEAALLAGDDELLRISLQLNLAEQFDDS